MGIYGALATAVTGLRSQSYALENISGNIANSQTTGYKRLETSFLDMIPDAPSNQQVAGSVTARSRSTNTDGGDVVSAASDTNMALNGSGFFVVEQKLSQNDGNAVFSGANFYTRRGDFDVDKEGYLVNGADYYLKGLPIDAATGNVSGSVPTVIQLSNAFLPAQQTTQINYELNLPLLPKTANYDTGVADSELLTLADYTGAPATIQASDSDNFVADSIAGGAITVYAANGAAADIQLRWAKVDSIASGGDETWNLFYLEDSSATGTDPMWRGVGVDYEFDSSGVNDPEITNTDLTAVTVNGTLVGDVKIQFGSGGVTQFDNANGTIKVNALSKNGFAAGEFLSVAVNSSGRVVASYDNGQQIELAQVVVADFKSANSLKRLDGGAFAATSESGEAILSDGAGISGGSLETSNTDISEEFTKLIVTQQAYSAGTRIVSTADEMLQEALNMVR